MLGYNISRSFLPKSIWASKIWSFISMWRHSRKSPILMENASELFRFTRNIFNRTPSFRSISIKIKCKLFWRPSTELRLPVFINLLVSGSDNLLQLLRSSKNCPRLAIAQKTIKLWMICLMMHSLLVWSWWSTDLSFDLKGVRNGKIWFSSFRGKRPSKRI